MIIDVALQIATVLFLLGSVILFILGYKNFTALNSEKAEINDIATENILIDKLVTMPVSYSIANWDALKISTTRKLELIHSRAHIFDYTFPIVLAKSIKYEDLDSFHGPRDQVQTTVKNQENEIINRYKGMLHTRRKPISRRTSNTYLRNPYPSNPITIQ